MCLRQTVGVDAALVSRQLNQLSGAAILLGHCGLERNHANSSAYKSGLEWNGANSSAYKSGLEWNDANSNAYKMLPVNQAKEFALLNHKQDSYLRW